jgi:hypothetical protein
MPACRLPASPADAITLKKYDVVGKDSSEEHDFTAHAALCRDDVVRVHRQARLSVVHMRPPFGQTDILSPVHAAATAELTEDERRQMATFVDRVAGEFAANRIRKRTEQYTIYPDVRPEREQDGTVRYWRFSCSGFVRAAYTIAGIALLPARQESPFSAPRVPDVTVATLKQAYGALADRLDDPEERAKFGLSGDGPWSVVLPGYIFHAMNRPAADIRSQPYLPKAGDEYFRG